MNDTERTTEAERNRTTHWIVTITLGLLIALVVGVAVGFLVAKPYFRKIFGLDGGRELAVSPPTQAIISLDNPDPIHPNDSSCKQYVGAPPGTGGILYARPSLSSSGKETIIWHGGISGDRITVTFSGSGLFGPFADPSYTTNQPSSAPTGGQSDFSFDSVTIVRGGTTYTCSNPQSMGVHISQ